MFFTHDDKSNPSSKSPLMRSASTFIAVSSMTGCEADSAGVANGPAVLFSFADTGVCGAGLDIAAAGVAGMSRTSSSARVMAFEAWMQMV